MAFGGRVVGVAASSPCPVARRVRLELSSSACTLSKPIHDNTEAVTSSKAVGMVGVAHHRRPAAIKQQLENPPRRTDFATQQAKKERAQFFTSGNYIIHSSSTAPPKLTPRNLETFVYRYKISRHHHCPSSVSCWCGQHSSINGEINSFSNSVRVDDVRLQVFRPPACWVCLRTRQRKPAGWAAGTAALIPLPAGWLVCLCLAWWAVVS